MLINTNINIIGGLPDFNLIRYFLFENKSDVKNHSEYTTIRTLKSVKRFKKAIRESFVSSNDDLNTISQLLIKNENPTKINFALFLIFSVNNDLFHYLNENVFFPIYYSGRKIIKKEEVLICLKDLQKKIDALNSWSESTINSTASKYLTLLKKFGLLSGIRNKEIVYKNLSSEEFIIFIYFLSIVDQNSNKINSNWIKYSFNENDFFVKKVMDRKLIPFFEIKFNGDNLKLVPTINFDKLYEKLKSS